MLLLDICIIITSDSNIMILPLHVPQLLSLSQKEAGGDGMHEHLRAATDRYIFFRGMARQRDPKAEQIMDQLVEDYRSMPHGKGGKFFTNKKRGMLPFMIKYIHYCMYGIDPDDKKKIDILYEFYYGSKAKTAALYYFKVAGRVLNLVEKFRYNRLVKKVSKIYEESPNLSSFPENDAKYGNLSRKELAESTIPIMAIAATVGPKHLLTAAMGCSPLPNRVDGVKTNTTDVFGIWDGLDLDDSSEIERYINEIGRLWLPVSHTHRVATEPFTVKMLLKDRTFPAGTEIMIPLSLSMFDENVWDDAFEFNHNRHDLVKLNMMFHSVGNKQAGRMCPGKVFAMKMISEIIVRCGKVRRE